MRLNAGAVGSGEAGEAGVGWGRLGRLRVGAG